MKAQKYIKLSRIGSIDDDEAAQFSDMRLDGKS